MKKLACLFSAIVLFCNLSACKPEQSEFNTPENKSEAPAKAEFSIPDSFAPTNKNGIYTLKATFEFPDAASSAISIKNDIILYDFVEPSLNTSKDTVVLYDIKAGKEKSHTQFDDDLRRIGQLKDGSFYDLSFDKNMLTEYSVSGKIKSSDKVTNADGISDAYLSPDGKRLIYQKTNGGGIALFDPVKKIEIPVSENVDYGFLLGADNKYFYMRGLKESLWKIDFSGNASVINSRVSAQLSLPYVTESNEGGYIIQNTTDNKMISFSADTEKEIIAAAGPGYLLSQSDDGLRLYDINNGKYTDIFPINGSYMTASYCDSGYFSVLSIKDGKFITTMILPGKTDYQNSFSSKGSSYEDFESIHYDNRSVDPGTEKMLKDIYEKYNVRVILKSQKFEEDICGYSCTEVSDVNISPRVKCVEDFLALMPAGMTNEISNGNSVWVYLCDNLHTNDTDNHVEGFASLFSGHPFIAINTTGKDIYFTETLAHEFSHLFDYALGEEWLSGWEKLSPTDGYCERRTNLPGKYTPYAMDGSDVYFFDIYSTSFPTEDRAVIFEKIYYEYASGEKVPDLHRKHIEEKVNYYAKMLKANFPSCEKAKKLFWEK